MNWPLPTNERDSFPGVSVESRDGIRPVRFPVLCGHRTCAAWNIVDECGGEAIIFARWTFHVRYHNDNGAKP